MRIQAFVNISLVGLAFAYVLRPEVGRAASFDYSFTGNSGQLVIRIQGDSDRFYQIERDENSSIVYRDPNLLFKVNGTSYNSSTTQVQFDNGSRDEIICFYGHGNDYFAVFLSGPNSIINDINRVSTDYLLSNIERLTWYSYSSFIGGVSDDGNLQLLNPASLQGVSVKTLSSTSVVFQIAQPLSTNYSVAGYYVNGTVTNGVNTEAGPAMWAITSLKPNTIYSFSFWVHDLVNNLNSSIITTNLTTLRTPAENRIIGYQLDQGKMRLWFIGETGIRYILDRSLTLNPPLWVSQETNTMGASGLMIFTNKVEMDANNFWRVRFVP